LTSLRSWRLALPMYNVTPALGRVWQAVLHAIADTLRRQGWQEPMELVEPAELMDFWRAPDLLLSQTCGYPLVTELRKDVRVLAVAEFDLPGCEGPMYRSAILVPELGARAVEELRGKVAAMNQPRSHSGMNALRHAIAPHALGGRFFSDVVASGGHLASMRMLQDGRADVAAIDCVTLGLACRPGGLPADRTAAAGGDRMGLSDTRVTLLLQEPQATPVANRQPRPVAMHKQRRPCLSTLRPCGGDQFI